MSHVYCDTKYYTFENKFRVTSIYVVTLKIFEGQLAKACAFCSKHSLSGRVESFDATLKFMPKMLLQ